MGNSMNGHAGYRRPCLRHIGVVSLIMILLAMLPLAPASAVSPPTKAYPTVTKGSRGENVRALQYLLKHHGHSVGVDGAFGTSTHNHILNFQVNNGLPVDGVVGPATWAKLANMTVKLNHSGNKVRAVTTLLRKFDNGPVLASYTTAVKQRVKDFQTDMGLTATGNTNLTTWKVLAFHYEQPSPFVSICKGLSNGVDTFNYPQHAWGTGSTVAYLEWSGGKMNLAYGSNADPAFRDHSLEHGGDIPGHGSHEHGMDIDVRPMTYTNAQCNSPGTWTTAGYSKYRQKAFMTYMKLASSQLGRDLHVKTYFNDPWIIANVSEVSWYTNHDNHTHHRFCTAYYPDDSKYDC